MGAPARRDAWRYFLAHQPGILLGSLAALLFVFSLSLLLVTAYQIRLLGRRRSEVRIGREAFDLAWLRLGRHIAEGRLARAVFDVWELWRTYVGVMKSSRVGWAGLALVIVVGIVFLAVLGMELIHVVQIARAWFAT